MYVGLALAASDAVVWLLQSQKASILVMSLGVFACGIIAAGIALPLVEHQTGLFEAPGLRLAFAAVLALSSAAAFANLNSPWPGILLLVASTGFLGWTLRRRRVAR